MIQYIKAKIWIARWATGATSWGKLAEQAYGKGDIDLVRQVADRWTKYAKKMGPMQDSTHVRGDLIQLANLLNIEGEPGRLMQMAAQEFYDALPPHSRRDVLNNAPDSLFETLVGIGKVAAGEAVDHGRAISAFTTARYESELRVDAALVDTMRDLPDILVEKVRSAVSLKGFRIAAPYETRAYQQTEFRKVVAERLLGGSLEVRRVEVFYKLERLKEVLHNVLRHWQRNYYVKSYCGAVNREADPVPGMGGYIFDDSDVLLGAYWTATPPDGKLGLSLKGEVIKTYFGRYWDEIWGRGTVLNPVHGSRDLEAVRNLAFGLGLPKEKWPEFVEEAYNLTIEDGAPPLF